jgi:uncharacterized membrane protein
LFKRDRPVFYCLLTAAALSLLASIITIFVHLPINSQLASWNPTVLPLNYLDILEQWRTWNAIRLILLFVAMGFTFWAMLLGKESNHIERNSL